MQALPPLAASLSVAVGGAAGAVLRYQSGRIVAGWAGAGFPYATLAVNTLGSLMMGALAGWLALRGAASEPWRLLLGVGLLGGFTTFSAFSLELVELAQRGDWGAAALYSGLSVALGVAALVLGLTLTRSLAA